MIDRKDLIITEVGSGYEQFPSVLQPIVDISKTEGRNQSIGKMTTIYKVEYEPLNLLVAMCGAIWYKGTCKFKNTYVVPQCRTKGVFKHMIDFRIEEARKRKIRLINTICTKMSINEYLRRGATKVRYYDGWGLTYVRLEI